MKSDIASEVLSARSTEKSYRQVQPKKNNNQFSFHKKPEVQRKIRQKIMERLNEMDNEQLESLKDTLHIQDEEGEEEN